MSRINTNKTKQLKVFTGRYIFLLIIMSCLLGIVTYRLVDLHIFKRDFLLQQGNARMVRNINIAAHRGMILDRNNEPLAVSIPIKSIWINPKEFKENLDNTDGLTKLAEYLEMPVEDIKEKLNKYDGKEFAYLKRHIAPDVEAAVIKLNLPGVNFQTEYKRFYPNGEVSANVVGFTDIDGNGQEGMELAFNNLLKGKRGKKVIIKDRLGREVENVESVNHAANGENINLSIDQRLQFLAYRELKSTIKKHNAKSGSVVILNVETGEILAMVNWPTFNPNLRESMNHNIPTKNMAVTDFFEPASAMKTFSVISSLEHTNTTPGTLIDTSPGIMKMPGGTIREWDGRNNGVIDVTTILKNSSNIGVAKLVLKLPSPINLWETYERFGFGAKTESGFPGESAGMLSQKNTETPFVLATMAFGYGVAVTPLQLARAYAILGAHGTRYPISFIKLKQPNIGVQVVSEKIAREVVDMLTMVAGQDVSLAKVPGYHVAEKTGTTRHLGKDGYERGRHRATCAGLAPALNSKFAIVATINDPQGAYYGNLVSAPLFARIAQSALRLYKVQPDVLEPSTLYMHNPGSMGGMVNTTSNEEADYSEKAGNDTP